jgi:hypothetical protein
MCAGLVKKEENEGLLFIMVESQGQGKLLCHTFTNANSKRNITQGCEWIKQTEMKRSQFVSLSMSESSYEDGENVIALVYRAAPSDCPADVPIDNLSFH